MSYEIIYDKQFIDLQDGRYVPLILCGSNNCYETTFNGRERRERGWHNFNYILKGKLAGTPEEMEKNAIAEKERRKQENDSRERSDWWEPFNEKQWGYWASLQIGSSTRGTTFGMYIGLFRTGCKKALTVEQLREYGVSIEIYHYPYSTEEFMKKHGHKPWSDTAKSTEYLKVLLVKYQEHDAQAYISLHGLDQEKLRWIRKKLFPRNKKEREQVPEYFCLHATGNGYISKLTARGYYYSSFKSSARKFNNRNAAER